MQSLCTLRDHRRQGSHNTRYQAGAAPYLDRFSTGWIAPACLAHLFDHLVGEGEHPWRNIEAQRLGGLKVDHQLELGRLQHREADSSARSQKMYMYRRASVARAVSCSSRVRRVSADRAICGRSPANAHDRTLPDARPQGARSRPTSGRRHRPTRYGRGRTVLAPVAATGRHWHGSAYSTLSEPRRSIPMPVSIGSSAADGGFTPPDENFETRRSG